jgi:hypothetical protein
MRRLSTLLSLPALLLAGCGPAPDGQASSLDPPPTLQPGEIVLRIGATGGIPPTRFLATELPRVTVYGDGRVITDRADGSANGLPELGVRSISTESVNQLIQLALDAGVGGDIDYGFPDIFDAGSVYFEVGTDTGLRRTGVYALRFEDGLTPQQIEARQPLIDLWDKLTDLPATLGPDAAGAEQLYQPAALAVVSQPWPDTTPEEPEREWPGPALPGDPFGPTGSRVSGSDLRCLTVTGTDLTAVLEEAQTATEHTPWRWHGDSAWETGSYALWFRPLLPDETSCDDMRVGY